MPITQSTGATPGLPDVYFTPSEVIEALQTAGPGATATETLQPFDFVLGNPPFAAGQSANA